MLAKAAASADSSSAGLVLIGALGGVLLTGIFGVLAALLTNKGQERKLRIEQEDRRWQILRDERKDAYLTAASEATELQAAIQGQEIAAAPHLVALGKEIRDAHFAAVLPKGVNDAIHRAELARLRLAIFGSAEVFAAFDRFVDVGADYVAARLHGDSGLGDLERANTAALETAFQAMKNDLS